MESHHRPGVHGQSSSTRNRATHQTNITDRNYRSMDMNRSPVSTLKDDKKSNSSKGASLNLQVNPLESINFPRRADKTVSGRGQCLSTASASLGSKSTYSRHTDTKGNVGGQSTSSITGTDSRSHYSTRSTDMKGTVGGQSYSTRSTDMKGTVGGQSTSSITGTDSKSPYSTRSTDTKGTVGGQSTSSITGTDSMSHYSTRSKDTKGTVHGQSTPSITGTDLRSTRSTDTKGHSMLSLTGSIGRDTTSRHSPRVTDIKGTPRGDPLSPSTGSHDTPTTRPTYKAGTGLGDSTSSITASPGRDSKLLMTNSRSSTLHGAHQVASGSVSEFGGARPKTVDTYGAESTGTQQPDERVYSPRKYADAQESDTKDKPQSGLFQSKDDIFHIQLRIVDKVHHQTDVKISCDIETYMKWCYIMKSPTKLGNMNAFLKSSTKLSLSSKSELLVQSDIPESLITDTGLRCFVDDVIQCVGKDLTVRCITVPDGHEEFSASILIEVPLVKATCFLYAEATGTSRVHLVYIASKEAAVMELVETHCPKLLQVRLLPVWTAMSRRIKLQERLTDSCPDVSFKLYECEESGDFICEICGSLSRIQEVEKKVLWYRDRLKCKDCLLSKHLEKACFELNLSGKIQEQIDKRVKGACLIQQDETGMHVYLYAFEETSLDQGKKIVIDNLYETGIKLNTQRLNPMKPEKLQQKLFEATTGDILVFEEENSIYIAGLATDVKEATDVALGILQYGHEKRSNSFPKQANEMERYSKQVQVSDTDLLEKLTMLAAEIAKVNHTELDISDTSEEKSLKFSGIQRDVEKSVKEFTDAKADLKKEQICVDTDFIRSQAGAEFIDQLQSEYKVQIMEEKLTGGLTDVVDGVRYDGSERKRAVREKQGKRTTWMFPSGKILILDLVDIKQCVEPDLLVAMTGKKSGTSGKYTKKGKTESKQTMIEAAVPNYHEGKKTDNEKKLHAYVGRLLSKATEDGHSSIGLSLEPAGNWHFLKFLEVVMGPVLRHLQEFSKEPGLKAITLCAHSLDKLKKTERLIRMSIDPDFVENEIQVEVVSGVLNLFEADILVNTTSPKLDLSYGSVSSAMLKSAGPELQKECRKNCAEKGVQRSAVVVTGGYNLPCQYVFHGALSTYRHDDPTTNLTELRAFLQNCLSKASEFDATSIALPVIGSGNLGFPTDSVASEMFISVDKLRQTERETDRQTSLRFVYFVVYKHDMENYKIFMRTQRDMVKYLVKNNAHSGNSPKHVEDDRRATQTMKVTVIGKSKSTELAVKALQDKVQTERPREKREDLTDAEIPPHVKDISANQYKALLKFFPGPFEDIRDSGVELRHTGDKLHVLGKVNDVKEAIDKIKELDKSLKEMFQINISVADSAPSDVQSTVRKITRNFEHVHVLYDKIMTMVHLYGEHEQVTEAGRLLGYYDPRLSGNKEKTKRIGREENMEASHRGAPMIKPTIERSFSWTTNAKNVKVYQVERMVVKVYEGNLLVAPSDCIVNAANKDLMHIAGVAGAIADKAGAELNKQSYQISQSGSLKVGSVVETTAGRMDYKYVLHTVGPSWFDYQPITADSLQQCEKDLYTAVLNTFKKAEELQLSSVALPAISSAIFRVPREICASQYTNAVCDFAKTTPTYLQEIYFVDQNNQMVNIIQEAFTTVITDGRPYKVNAQVYYDPHVKSGIDTKGDRTGGKEDQSTGGMVPQNPIYKIDKGKMTCSFTTSQEVRIYTDNILALNGIDAIVCSEDRSWSAAGMVARELQSKGGSEYTEAKSRAKKTHIVLNDGDVVVTIGGRNRYPWVIHALVPNGKPPEALKELSENILEHCRAKGFKSAVMSLLGSGSGRINPTVCARQILEAYDHFCVRNPGYKFTLHLVNNLKDKTQVLHSVFMEHIDRKSRKWKDLMLAEASSESAHKAMSKEKSIDRDRKDNNKGKSGQTGDNTTEKEDETIFPEDLDQKGEVEVYGEIPDLSVNCVICLYRLDNPKQLKCGHEFCTGCIEQHFKFKQACPTCFTVIGIITGDQPDGEMEIQKLKTSVAGYEGYESIGVSYSFDNGNQGPEHPHPGHWYKGISRTGYLPHTEEGRKICVMLKVAFERRLVFTIGTSRTTGQEGVITWNDIHHKTDHRPNTQFGYPDPTYLQRVKEELTAKGVFEEDMDQKLLIKLKKSTSFRERFSVKK